MRWMLLFVMMIITIVVVEAMVLYVYLSYSVAKQDCMADWRHDPSLYADAFQNDYPALIAFFIVSCCAILL